MQFLQCLGAIVVALRPAVRTAEMIKAVVRAKELAEIGPPQQCPIEVRAVCRAAHLLIIEVTCWKDKVDRMPRGVR
tara:strand:- start:301 stop:528 length:228 start_codon:yes stop_codon:yes gene_type:complete